VIVLNKVHDILSFAEKLLDDDSVMKTPFSRTITPASRKNTQNMAKLFICHEHLARAAEQ
jgi:hypothetical protein